jgi:phosphoglycolate phosphatase
MSVGNIFFDLDGTLVDTLPGIEHSCLAAVRSVLPGRKLGGLRQRMGPPIREIFRQVFNDLNEEKLDELLSHFRASYDNEGWKMSVAYPGVPGTLRRLSSAGLRCFVLTNKPSKPTYDILRGLRLCTYFDRVICPDVKSARFTSKAEELRYLLEELRLAAGQCVFIGDSEDDALAARSCEVPFIAAAYGYGQAHLSKNVTNMVAVISKFPRLIDLDILFHPGPNGNSI